VGEARGEMFTGRGRGRREGREDDKQRSYYAN
jgi:hypothetical protein